MNQRYSNPYLRHLLGSNCFQVKTGVVPKYTACVGCREEVAIACVNILRHNSTNSVSPLCHTNILSNSLPSEYCCPQFFENDLEYIGSAYPMALKCLQSSGCESSVFYSQLLLECETVCINKVDPRNDQSVCFAQFNTGNSYSPNFNLLFMISMFTIMMLFSK